MVALVDSNEGTTDADRWIKQHIKYVPSEVLSQLIEQSTSIEELRERIRKWRAESKTCVMTGSPKNIKDAEQIQSPSTDHPEKRV